tara:strand:+ start:1005 stop:1565 length:561 start_codon:yes stop_codon:yes gene_type:complete
MRRSAVNNVNYQERSKQFAVGDIVAPFGVWDAQGGRVTAVWPAIGMVDVEFSVGNRRYPVEDLQRIDSNGNADPPHTNSVPGGQPTVQVPGGPSGSKVAAAFAKKSLYWAGRDRQYRMTSPEVSAGCPDCPKCGQGYPLKKAIYKRRDGSSDRLRGCSECMFLIKEADIVNLDSGNFQSIETEGPV